MNLPPATKNITAGRLVRALLRDGFVLKRTRGKGRTYKHSDGRTVRVHFHHSGQTFPPGTRQKMLADAGWDVADLKRLRLIPKRDP